MQVPHLLHSVVQTSPISCDSAHSGAASYGDSVLGVHPKAQGRGYGRSLLDAVQALAQAHPAAVGVALDTENPANVELYQRCGSELTVQTTLDTLDVWFMFRANAPDAGRTGVG